MSTDYTPTTEWLRIMVGYAKATATDRTKPVEAARAEGYEWFDRWLAAHDAETKAAALGEAATRAEEWAVLADLRGYARTTVTSAILANATRP